MVLNSCVNSPRAFVFFGSYKLRELLTNNDPSINPSTLLSSSMACVFMSFTTRLVRRVMPELSYSDFQLEPRNVPHMRLTTNNSAGKPPETILSGS